MCAATDARWRVIAILWRAGPECGESNEQPGVRESSLAISIGTENNGVSPRTQPARPRHPSCSDQRVRGAQPLTAAAGRNSRPFGRPPGTKPGIAALAGVQILPLDTHGRSLWERLGPA